MGWFNDIADVVEDAVEEAVDWVEEAGETIGDGFDKDGWFTEFVQDNIPLGGFVTAIAHSAAGNNDYAELAAVKGLATTVDFAVGMAATAVAGPIAGGAVSGFLGPIIKGGINELGREYMVDEDLKDELKEWNLEEVALSAVMGAGIGAATGAAGEYIKGVAGNKGWLADVSERAVYTNSAGEIIEEGAESAIITYTSAPLTAQVRHSLEGLVISKTLKAPLNEARSEIIDAILPDDVAPTASPEAMEAGLLEEAVLVAGDGATSEWAVDVDGDGDVDEFDLALPPVPTGAASTYGDVDGDGDIDAADEELGQVIGERMPTSELDLEADLGLDTGATTPSFGSNGSGFADAPMESFADAPVESFAQQADAFAPIEPETAFADSDSPAMHEEAPPPPDEFDTNIQAADSVAEAADDVWEELT